MVGAAAVVAAPSRQARALDRLQPSSTAEAVTAQGTVFEDSSAHGYRQPGDRGIAGVMVSNGRDVVITDRDGRWRLPVENGDSLFVVKPPGWSVSGGESGLARFSYLHQPLGSTPSEGRRFAGVAPTGPLPRSIDFPLRRCIEPARFDVLLVADTQPSDETELDYVRDALLTCASASGAAFAIHHGDVMGDDLGLYERYTEMLRATGLAWHHCPGNHDMNLESRDGHEAFETWKRVFGPPHYAFQHGEATFILLNNVEYFGWDNIPSGKRGYRGRIGARQLAFVENVLRYVPEHHFIVVSMHIPLVCFEDPTSEADLTVDRRALLELLARRRHSVSFAGHSHTTEHHYLGGRDGFNRTEPHHHHVLTAACGSWWSGPLDHRGIPVSVSRDGSPKGFHVLSIDGNRYRTRFVATDAMPPAQSQLRLLVVCGGAETGEALGCQVKVSALAEARFVADVFDGGPRTEVHIEIDGGNVVTHSMVRETRPDPYVTEFFARHAGTCKPWAAAAPSSHMWSAPLPRTLQPGAYRVVARARNEYGQEHVAHMVLEVRA